MSLVGPVCQCGPVRCFVGPPADILFLSNVDAVLLMWGLIYWQYASHRSTIPSTTVSTSRLRKSFTHLSGLAAKCRRFLCDLRRGNVFNMAAHCNPRFVCPSWCAKCLRACGPRSTKMGMSSYRATEAYLTRHVGFALLYLVCLFGVHRIEFRRSLVDSVMLGCTPRLRKMQKAHIAVAIVETKPLLLGSLSFRNSTLQICCKLWTWIFTLVFGARAGW